MLSSGSHYRSFGSQVYSYNGEDFRKKKNAIARAKELRLQGWWVRILHEGDMYFIYTRRKE